MEREESGESAAIALEERVTSQYNEKDPILTSKGSDEDKSKAINTVQLHDHIHLPTHGLSVLTCTLFIVGEMASSGLLALPRAIVNAGWSGVILLVVWAMVALYCGVLIGRCWTQLRSKACVEEAFPRDPYPTIGYQCYGRAGKAVVEFCLLVTLFGAVIVFLLVSAQNVASLVDKKIGSFETPEGETRAWILILSAFLLPCTYLGTPKDIWPIAALATFSTAVACILIAVKCILDWPIELTEVQQYDITAESVFRAFGTISFAFGGISLFPSFQADMKKPEKFTRAAVSAILVVLLMYLPTCVLPFLVYGAKNEDNILQTIKRQGDTGSAKSIAIAAEVIVTFHLSFAFLIALNPISQQIEEYLQWPNRFGFKRILLRTSIFLFVLGIAEAVPKFGVILSLVGGSTVTMMTFILPCIFYLKLNPDAPLYIKVLHAEIILIAIGSGSAATYSAFLDLKRTFLNY